MATQPERSVIEPASDIATEKPQMTPQTVHESQVQLLLEDYADIALEIEERQERAALYLDRIEKLQSQFDDLDERREMLAEYLSDIERVEGLLSSDTTSPQEKRLARDHLAYFKRGQDQARSTLQRDYQITPEQITKHQEALLTQAEELAKQARQLPTLEDLRSEQVQIREQYQQLLAENPEIMAAINTSPPLESQHGLSPTMRRLQSEARRELSNVGEDKREKKPTQRRDQEQGQGI